MPAEPTSPDNQRTYAGKYQSPEALESGYNELFRLQQRTTAERRALEERNRLLEASLSQLQQGGTDSSSDDADLTREQIAALVASQTAETVQQILDPLLKGAEAVTHFGPDQAAINKFLSETPEIQTTFQSMVGANPEGAAHYVKLAYNAHLSETQENRVQTKTSEARALREASLPSASLPPSRGVGRVPPDPNADHAERLEKAWDTAQKTGDASTYARLRLNEGPNKVEAWWPDEPPPASYLRAQAEERA